MPRTIVRQRSQSLGDLPIKSVLKAKNVRVKVQSKKDGWLKVDFSFDADPPLPESNEPTPLKENDFPPEYDELEKQVKILNRDKNLEKWLRQSKVRLPKGVDISAVKDKLREFEKRFAKDEKDTREDQIPYYEHLKAKLHSLNEDGHLEQWLDTLEYKPKDVSLIKQRMQDYFKTQAKNAIPRTQPREKPGVNPSTKSSQHIPGKLWERFLEMPPLQKTAIVVGITVVAAGAGILTWTLIGAAFPPVFAVVQGQFAGFFAEFAFEMNRIRNEVSFSLLSLTVEQAKPLSRAWRDQFLIWKYI
ncbi:unnamed protein product [Allacma fusca]|uniref:Uncharacterized protein n=1 Tax=Allacma fusca TaxID=39272 RepID=A0A8J2JXC9_9HEXA|nr:unnamed protein product [Allacma fusca]